MSETDNRPASADDDWAAALKEQAVSGGATIESAAAIETVAQPANIFPRLSPGAPADGAQDLDLILDIPVHPKSRIQSLHLLFTLFSCLLYTSDAADE